MASVTQNFDWAETQVPLVIFIPNRQRGTYIRDLFHQFQTNSTNYLIVVGNDGYHEDFSDLPGVKQFTIERTPNHDRNGCFIRNYFIKRCQSENIFQKDPETELLPAMGYDWIKEYTEIRNRVFRPFETMALNEEDGLTPVNPLVSHRVHWGFLCPTFALQNIRGYDESYTHYGYEDTDLYERLMLCHSLPMLDRQLMVMHWPHDVGREVFRQVNEMAKIYAYRDRYNCVRNPCGWGEG